MCGIAGLFDSSGDARPMLEAMRGALAHRGPDASGIHTFPGGGLAHTRLSVIDCSAAANQPFAWADGRYHLVYNGELYNFRELRHELEQHGARFQTQSDTEVLAAALAQWGADALPKLNGMFAFAWHDAEDQSLLLARDRLGIKPLFYTTGRLFAFASELGALKAAGLASGPLDRDALDAYLALQYIPAPRTIYEGIRKLRPGHWLRVTRDGIEERAWWTLRYESDTHWTLDSAAERYRELLDDAVRLQRVADVPLGAFLSGGLDSSSVVAVMAKQSDRPIETFSIGFNDPQANELPYARSVAKAFHTNHHEAIAEADLVARAPSPVQLLSQVVASFGEPFADSSAIPTWLVSKLAREHVTVALSGDGGDEIFAGYTWLHRTLQTRGAAALPAPLRDAAIALSRLAPQSPTAGKARRFLQDAGLPLSEAFRRRLTTFGPELRHQLLGRSAAWDPFAESWQGVHASEDVQRMLGVDTTLYLPDDILTKVDRMSMAHALEVRVPLLDHRIVEFAATLPFPLQYAQGIGKRVPRHAFRNDLPAGVLRPRKRGFALPIDAWFLGELGELFKARVLNGASRLTDTAVAARLFKEHQSGQENHGHRLWALLVLEEFLSLGGSRSRAT